MHISKLPWVSQSFEYSKLTDLDFLPLAPTAAPLFATDDDGCMGGTIACGSKAGDGAPADIEGIDCDVFCFFREAETLGLGIASGTG